MSDGWIYDEIPGGSRQDFGRESSKVPWKRQPNIHLLHSTEGYGYPGYAMGGNAPHITINPRQRTMRQHFSLNEGSRALRYSGRSTNGMGVLQYEVIGSCSPALIAGGVPSVLDFDDGDLAYIALVLATATKHTGIPLTTSLYFMPYPQSYGSAAGNRMGYAAFAAYRGVMGHQHAPDNTHGDPGSMNVARILEIANTGEVGHEVPRPKPLDGKLDEDGRWGRNTTTDLQGKMGTPVDGEVWYQNVKWEARNPGLTSGWVFGKLPSDGGPGSPLIRAMQVRMKKDGNLSTNVKTDGILGPVFVKGLQRRFLGKAYDDVLDNPSSTIEAMQKRLNSTGKF